MKLRTAIVTATTAAVLATSGIAIAGAADGSSPAPSSDQPAATAPARDARVHPGFRHRARVKIRRLVRGAGGVVTKTIGIDRKTLRQEIRSGKTIAEIATAHGVDPQKVIDALVAAANERIGKAVANGRIPAERAAKIKERVTTRITRIVSEWHPRKLRTATAA